MYIEIGVSIITKREIAYDCMGVGNIDRGNWFEKSADHQVDKAG